MRELIKTELKENITQRDLAERMHFSHSTLQKILFTTTNHTYDIRKKVADYFHVPVSDFYDGVPGQRSPKTAAPSSGLTWEMVKALCDGLQKQLDEQSKRIDLLQQTGSVTPSKTIGDTR